MDSTLYVKWFTSIDDANTRRLMAILDNAVNDGVGRVVLLLSTPGGNVYCGLSAHNYLKGLPLEVVTHNFGSADSIGLVVYCAGSTRLSVPNARFLLHSVVANFAQGAAYEETQLEERLKGLRADTANIAAVIASTIGKTESEVHEMMRLRTILSVDEARALGLVQGVESALIPAGARVESIQ